jgi:hypothetical protein
VISFLGGDEVVPKAQAQETAGYIYIRIGRDVKKRIKPVL